jgi:glucose-6-phosphate dehydrogenase assembly protein OpcA
MRFKPLPAQPRIQTCEGPGGLVHSSRTLLHAVLPAFFQLQQQIIDVLLPGLNQPVWLTQDPARHEMLQSRMRMP